MIKPSAPEAIAARDMDSTSLQSPVAWEGSITVSYTHLFRAMLHALSADLNEAVSAYCDFTAALYEQGGNWSEYLLSAALEDENVYMVRLAEHGSVEPEISDSLMRELFILQKAAGITSGELQQEIGYEGPLPVWGITSVDFIKAYEERVQAVSRHGYGIYAKYHTFVLKNGEIAPVPVSYTHLPIADIFHPMKVIFLKMGRYKPNVIFPNRLNSRFGKRLHFYKPLKGNPRLDRRMTAVAGTDFMRMRLGFNQIATLVQILYDLSLIHI